MVATEGDVPLSESAVNAMVQLEYLTQVLPDTPALPPATLAIRADLPDRVDVEDVAGELQRAGLITRTPAGLVPTGKEWGASHCFAHHPVFACSLDDQAVICIPRSWTPPLRALAASEYAGDEYLMARLGLLPVIAALARDRDQEHVSIGMLHEWAQDPADIVLNLVVDGLLPDQPHLTEELAEFRAQRQLRDIEMGMPAIILRA